MIDYGYTVKSLINTILKRRRLYFKGSYNLSINKKT